MNELIRLKNILNELGYLNIYLSLYLKNTQKEDNLENMKDYILSKVSFSADTAIILGSGMGAFADGLKKPRRSMKAPSLGFLESATVIK